MNRLPLIVFVVATCCVAAVPLAPSDTIAERAKPCLACHAAEGRTGKNEYYPRLAGKPQGYLFYQIVNFRDSRLHHCQMALLMQNLSDACLGAPTLCVELVSARTGQMRIREKE